jgi:superfamily II DNA or RNA helicase
MEGRPYLVDNQVTPHAGALDYLLKDLPGRPLSVATGYVNLGGLHHLAVAVADGRRVRLLIGAAPDPALGADLPIDRFERAVRALAAERDLARFPPSRAATQLGQIDTWLDQPTVEVRRYIGRFLHGKAYMFGTLTDARAAVVTSANLTSAGLHTNLELGLVDYHPPDCIAALTWFEALWTQAADFGDELRALLFPDPGLVDPQTVYLRALLDLYGDELSTTVPDVVVTSVALATFQSDGYERARRILARHHGVVYADGVGTGKTEIGLAFIEEYALRRGHHALVVAPAQLVPIWQKRIHQARLPAQAVSYQQLASDEQLVPSSPTRRRHLANARDSYRLVIVDEAHALRSPDTTWHRAMESLLGGERKDVVLLTATPVNNGLWDLYHLVMVFARHDRAFAPIGIPSVRDMFLQAGANERDPENLDTDVLFPLADAVSVRRDRRFIEEHYPGAVFPDGTPVRFPTPLSATVRYDLDSAHPQLFEDIVGWIGNLTMARYRPSRYALDEAEASAETSLGGLLQSAILKRFESCWAACLATVKDMVVAHDIFLASWDNGFVPSKAALRTAVLTTDEVGLVESVAELLNTDGEARSVDEFRSEYRGEVAADREWLLLIRDRLRTLDAATDPKLATLQLILAESPSKKVAVFATYADTVRYLDEHLPILVGGRERVTVIGTDTDPDMRTRALARFAPNTVVEPGYSPPDGEVDLLLSTDVLSEGQNLQQAGAVVSYDMPWNPQRVVQRNGRVIRLKSPHETVTLTTMLPVAGDLDRALRLEATIRRKVVAARLYGMETPVIDPVEAEQQQYAELQHYAARLADGDPALLDADSNDRTTGTFTGEALRAQLLRAVAEGELARLDSLPWGIGAAFRQGAGVPSSSAPGIFFACRTKAGRRYWRFVETGGAVIVSEAEILRGIDPGTALGADLDTIGIDLEGAWSIATASIIAEHNGMTDPRRAEERIGPLQSFALDLLRDPRVMLPPGAADAEEALSAERSSAVRQALGEVRSQLLQERISREEAASAIVAVVARFGLRAVEPPPLLDPIVDEDIGVVCWMAVLPAQEL